MDTKQVAGAWIAAVVVLSLCLGGLSHFSESYEPEGAGAQMIYTAPVRAGLPRTWFEATGSLPPEIIAPETIADIDYDDSDLEIDPPDPSDYELAFGELQ